MTNIENRHDRWVTIPNTICLIRLFGSFAIIPFAIAGRQQVVLTIFVCLAMTDWIDGKIARWFDQRSKIGPRLDSVADICMYAMLLFSAVWLFDETLWAELPLLLLAGGSFVAGCAVSLVKFRCFPSYHTRAAKTSWLLMVIATVFLFMDWSVWPLRIALLVITYTNLEGIAITLLLNEPATNVSSYAAARRSRHQSRDREPR